MNYQAIPPGHGCHRVRCKKNCGRSITCALRSWETAETAKRICEPCAAARARRLAPGIQATDIVQFGKRVQRVAVEMGVGLVGNAHLRKRPAV